jgi:hypothetical protein
MCSLCLQHGSVVTKSLEAGRVGEHRIGVFEIISISGEVEMESKISKMSIIASVVSEIIWK